MNLSKNCLGGLVLCFSLVGTGCLKTMSDVRTDRREASPEEQKKAVVALAEEKEASQMRVLSGKVESLEFQLQQLQQVNANPQGAVDPRLEGRLQAFEEALRSMDERLKALESRPTSSAAKKPAAKRSLFDEAESLFGAKNWKKAIVAYEKYRTKYPKGRKYSESTYKIGVSFQELGLKSEAKAFFQEVVDKFPKSSQAKKAKYRMKAGKLN